ncbi:hypothetical protein D3C72_1465000 [compost metagenome]
MGAATWAEASGGVDGPGRPVLVAVPTLPFFAAGIGRGRQGGQSGPAKGGQSGPAKGGGTAPKWPKARGAKLKVGYKTTDSLISS